MEEEFVLSDFLKKKMEDNIKKLKNPKIEETPKKQEAPQIEERENFGDSKKKGRRNFSKKIEDLKIVAERKEDDFSVSENELGPNVDNFEDCLIPDLLTSSKDRLESETPSDFTILQISDENLLEIAGIENNEDNNLQDLLDRPNCEFDLSGTPLSNMSTKLLLKNLESNSEIFIEELRNGQIRFNIAGKIFPLSFSHRICSESYETILIDKKSQVYKSLSECDSPEYFVVNKLVEEKD